MERKTKRSSGKKSILKSCTISQEGHLEETEEETDSEENSEEQNVLTPQQFSLWGEISEETSREIIENLHFLSKFPDYPDKTVDILIRSPGGDAVDMFAICDAMEHLKGLGWTVSTKGFGNVMSAAIPILSYGSKGTRKAGRSTRFMIHSVSSSPAGTFNEVRGTLQEIEGIQELYIQKLVESSKMKRKQIESIFKQNIDFYFSAEEAKKFGIIDIIE